MLDIYGATFTRRVGAIVNVGSTSHPYYLSLILEGVWGFPSVEFEDWALLENDTPILLFLEHRGTRGIWVAAHIVEKFPNTFPVSYWFKDPYSRPFQFRLRYILPERVDHESLDTLKPITIPELRERGFSQHGRWEIAVFADRYPNRYEVFEAIKAALFKRNSLGKQTTIS
ncbi:hypothetical protein B9Q03_03205 [Candidatus Marsarchaeota G2 archaeon OSP_D]|jgi:hypothetical protein|uniref:EVE domain-containing protein n=2 Tax=Candidatus Marsarchaeota group 2 TaxID=2203771 RepID=A0A2R6B4Q8_9ARCH|nr:MAG: hypothetical protein B9Q03_03205 [Candidatus Marsarchaeota G2 archaeon OSP_D]PSN93625.1 MAG: hypothetical protein B9Q09_05510 [Candidatus Marsarchaeota G2 archaeon ECH_B_SAG-C16]